MRVMGIDPGLATTGFGVVERAEGRLRALDLGVVRTPSDAPVELRLVELAQRLGEMLARWDLDGVAIERLFFNANARTAMAVGQASGVALAAAAAAGLSVACYTPTEVKSSVAGAGDASKRQVAAMVGRALRLRSAAVPADATDACALALCHLNRAGLARAIAGALG